MQLASDTSSANGNCPFPTFLLLSLTHLTLVCLKHCTRRSFSCSEQKPRSEDLFVEVVELLCAVPQMILEILSHLVAVLSGTKLSEFGCVISTAGRAFLRPREKKTSREEICQGSGTNNYQCQTASRPLAGSRYSRPHAWLQWRGARVCYGALSRWAWKRVTKAWDL